MRLGRCTHVRSDTVTHILGRGLAAAILACLASCPASARTAQELCDHPGIQHAAAQSLGRWAQNFPFARVIIGNEGGDGSVGGAEVAIENNDFVVCRGIYQLVKAGRDGNAYRVGIPQFFWRVEPDGSGYRVALVDMPDRLDGSNMPSRELLSRFTINDRPYTDVLADNQRRLQRRGRDASQ